MTIVKELNELAEKITGTNPKATTDAQAVNYIEENYSGGGSGGGATTYVIDLGNSNLNEDGTYDLSQEALTIIANASAEVQAGKVPNIYVKNNGAYFKAITVEAQISAGDLMFHVIPIGPSESLSNAKNVYIFYQTPDTQIQWEVA